MLQDKWDVEYTLYPYFVHKIMLNLIGAYFIGFKYVKIIEG